jgi:hypothetical protein
MEGRFDEGIKHARQAVKLDPLTAFNQHNLGWCLYYARRFDESINQYQKTAAANPLYPLAFLGLSWGLRFVGRHEEALTAINRAQELAGDSVFMLTACGQTSAAAGNRAEAEKVLRKLENLAEDRYVSPYHVSIIHTLLGDKNQALDTLEKAIEKCECWLAWMGVEPIFDVLRDDPRFFSLFESTANPLLHRAETLVIKKEIDTFAGRTDTIELTDDQKFHVPAAQTKVPRWIIGATALIGIVISVSIFASQFGWRNSERKAESAPNLPAASGLLRFVKSESAGGCRSAFYDRRRGIG